MVVDDDVDDEDAKDACSLYEVIERFHTARAKGGGGHPMNIPSMPPPSSSGRGGRSSGSFTRPSLHPALPTPSIIDPEDH